MANNKKMRTIRARHSDIISNLPENIIENILMCLPTRDAVKTSTLSKKWRYRSGKLPRLILDEMFWYKPNVKHSDINTVAMILYQILLLHEGPIKKFTLAIPGLEGYPKIDNIICFLSRNGIEDLILNMQPDRRYRLPSSFFTCQQLRHLSLQSCLIDSPPAFKGFSRLITLKLDRVGIRPEQLESLISSCPLLEILDLLKSPLSFTQIHNLLKSPLSFTQIQIDAPNMKTFITIGSIHAIIFKNVPHLSQVTLVPVWLGRGAYNSVKFFDNLPVIKFLHLNHIIVKTLAAGEVPSRLLTIIHLQDLKLSDLILEELNVLSFILCLIRSSPNLKHVDIELLTINASNSKICLELLKEQCNSDVMLDQLKEVKMQEVNGTVTELELIKFLLAKSPSLKQMRIRPQRPTADNGCKILRELTKFRRASAEAEVIYVDQEENQG